MKRVAVLVMSRHITSLGGIGFYVDSFLKHAKDHVICDVIVDRPVSKDDIPFPNIRESNIICGKNTVPYKSSGYFMYYNELSSFELGSNIMDSFLEASFKRMYDSVFIQSYELAAYVKHMMLDRIIPTYSYTHHNMFYHKYPDFLDECGGLHDSTVRIPHVTQVPDFNFPFLKTCLYSPLLTSDSEFIRNTKPNPEKGSVLFNGTYRDIKNPQIFVEYCIKKKKKAKVITNKKGKEFFEKEFSSAGIEHDVRINIFGQEKIDFIASAEMMFHPASEEQFSYAVLEGLCFMPVFVYDHAWSRSFPKGTLNFVDNLDFDISDTSLDGSTFARNYFDSELQVTRLIDSITSPIGLGTSSSGSLKDVTTIISKDGGLSVFDYWTTLKNRKSLCYADLVTLYKIKNSVTIENTESQTWLGSVVNDTTDLDSFFS